MKTTKQITTEYKVSRQTIQKWFRQGILQRPNKDHRGWFIWNHDDELKLERLITNKKKENNLKITPVNKPLYIQNRRYLGAKTKLLNFIEEVVDEHTENVKIIADIFGGTGVVSDLFQKKGFNIIINDILYSNYISYLTWFGNESVNYNKIKKIIAYLNSIEAKDENYVSKNFGDRYFTRENAKKIGAVREEIDIISEKEKLNNREKSFLLTSLLYAIDKVSNTVGHYDAYRKKMDSLDPIYLKVPEFNDNNNNKIFCSDANQLVKEITADLIYIDTPYNSRQYGDSYHLLENIMEWKKPKVQGVAKKMINRQHIKSSYSTQKAPEAFKDLINNINAKYILVSYNNMAKKGNGRSNAKISNEEILNILSSKGSVKTFEVPFPIFNSGKTNIKDHKEILYLCEVKNKTQKKCYINSAVNYTGNKFKLLPQIEPKFPNNINTFYDVFTGGASVGINVPQSKRVILNDINIDLIQMYKLFKDMDLQSLLKEIEKLIKEYGFTNTKEYGYKYYNANSSDGLNKINKESYLTLRNDFNNGKFSEQKKLLAFYVLIVFAFNNQIRFNSSGFFNIPVGKRDFNRSMEQKLIKFKKQLEQEKVILSHKDFREVLNSVDNSNDFVYLDPPYLISAATYNENNGWNEEDEKDLLNQITDLDKRGIRFALSNVLEHKGQKNKLLQNWMKPFNVYFLESNYNNSNYQSKAKDNDTIEVLITNY